MIRADTKRAPVVSVLTTLFNRESYVADCIRSIQAQSFEEWGLVIVDDGSRDRSVDVARSFAIQDPRIRIYCNEKNLGDYPNRNRAASLARGKYIKYLDADDILYPHSLRIMVEAMERFPDAGLALSCNVIDDQRPYPDLLTPREACLAHFLGTSPLGVGPSAAIIRRDAFERVGGFSGRQYVGDIELWIKLARVAPVVKLQPALVWWRRHEGQQMAGERCNRDILTVRYRMQLDLLDQCRDLLSEHETNLARSRLGYRHARTIWRMALKERAPVAACKLAAASGLGPGALLGGLWRRSP